MKKNNDKRNRGHMEVTEEREKERVVSNSIAVQGRLFCHPSTVWEKTDNLCKLIF